MGKENKLTDAPTYPTVGQNGGTGGNSGTVNSPAKKRDYVIAIVAGVFIAVIIALILF
jgi:hypothetical protein